MRCPVCRAENADDVTACRRCKADMSLLIELEKARDRVLAQAANAAAIGDGAQTLQHARAAHNLRRGDDSWRMLAIANLLIGDYGQAVACHAKTDSRPD